MLADAEKYKAEDEEVAARVTAKNGLESYAYSLKSTLAENGDKFDAADKEQLEKAVSETISFLEGSSEAALKDEIDSHRSELEKTASPIMQKFYGASGGAPGGGAPGGFPGGAAPGPGADGPSVEEVD